jgi:hypothetical protein
MNKNEGVPNDWTEKGDVIFVNHFTGDKGILGVGKFPCWAKPWSLLRPRTARRGRTLSWASATWSMCWCTRWATTWSCRTEVPMITSRTSCTRASRASTRRIGCSLTRSRRCTRSSRVTSRDGATGTKPSVGIRPARWRVQARHRASRRLKASENVWWRHRYARRREAIA